MTSAADTDRSLDKINRRILRALQDDGRFNSLKLAEAMQAQPEILECHLVASGFDYLLKTRVADMAASREFIGTAIWTLPGVRETRTYAVMEEVKRSTKLPL